MMSGTAESAKTSEQHTLDEAIRQVKDKAREFARLPASAKAALLRDCIGRLVDAAPEWVSVGCAAKGLVADQSGEEWLAGPMTTVRMMRLCVETLEEIHARGKPPLGRAAKTRADGRVEVDVFPSSLLDKIAFAGFRGYVLMQPGVDRGMARRQQASFYDVFDPEGGVSLILGAGNVSSIPPMDVFTKMFQEGKVCLLKMNPVNEWVGPILERVLQPFVTRGYLRIVYGGGDVGKYLVEHPDIDDVHITGSDRTHDLIVWGAPGPERDRRLAAKDPLLKKPITSELGNVSPVAIVPYAYSEAELWFQARNVVSMVTNNASFNCNAAKILITAKGWPQREKFLDLVAHGLGSAPTRKAYYPGAKDRYQNLVGGRSGVQSFGQCTTDQLAWAFVRGVDAEAKDERLFQVEPFCGILSETSVGTTDPVEFLGTVTRFMNERIWGTLNAALIIHPKLEFDPTVSVALDRAIVDLRYGTVAINHWPAVCYGVATLPWGGHPSATLENIQSGLGWVHNTYFLETVEKSVIRGPLVVKPTPPWFFDNTKGRTLGPKLVKLEASPGYLNLASVVLGAL
jgi:aldehyde dehydrogenase (NAD(P)+)